MLKLGIDPEKLYRAIFIRHYGLCCCNMALVSFRLFCKNLGHSRDFFGEMVYRPPWQKISRTPMLLATVDYVSHESELLTRFHSGQILHNQHEISNVKVQTSLP